MTTSLLPGPNPAISLSDMALARQQAPLRSFTMPVRVYLEDTDSQGFVYNASYIRFMERARTECLREAGIDHDECHNEFGVQFVLARIEASFMAPSRLSEMLSGGRLSGNPAASIEHAISTT